MSAVRFMLLICAGLSISAAAPPATRDCPDCPLMVDVPSGSFAMGADGGEAGRPEGPVHRVTVPAFALAKTETTWAQYAAFVADTGHVGATGCRRVNAEGTTVVDVPGASWRDPNNGRPVRPDEPVTCVSWHDAQDYAAWLTKRTGKPYRLPSEAEWEYAARAGSTTAYPWGDDVADGCVFANMNDARRKASGNSNAAPGAVGNVGVVPCDDGFAEAAPVGSLLPNAFGIQDMIGNVWEWTADCYVAPYPDDVPTDGSAYRLDGACERRSVRGGAWITPASRQRAAWRGRDPAKLTNWIFGFRVARSDTSQNRAGGH